MRAGRGFTIVELLIVIVVIAILAAISIVTYRGIQEKARTSALLAAVDQWSKLIPASAVDGSIGNGLQSCLGKSIDDFPARDGFASGSCLTVNGESMMSYREDFFAGWPDGTSRLSGEMPVTSVVVGGSTYRARGLWTFNPASDQGISIIWIPQVSEECGKGDVYASTGSPSLAGGMCILSVQY